MPAVQETVEQVRRIDVDQYKYGFVTRHRIRQGPQGPVRGHRPLHLGQEERAGMDAGLAARGLSALADHARADLGAGRAIRRSTTRTLYYYSAPKKKDGPKSLDEVDPEILATYEKLGIPLREQEMLLGISARATRGRGGRQWLRPGRGRRGVRFGLGRHHLQGGAEEGRRDLHADLGGAARASRSGEEISRLGGAGLRQFLRHAQLGGVLRRLVRLRAAGRALPDGAVDLFPHQREEHRPVRAHADHRRQGLLRELPRRLHRADARREPAARRGGRAGRARRRRDQVFDRAELVSGRRQRQGRHLQLRHQARRLPRHELEDLLDPGRDRLGDHLEISELHPARRQFARRVLFDRHLERPPAGRFRHQDAPSRQEHDEPDHLQGHRGRPAPTTPIAAWSRRTARPRARATSPTATRC